MKILLPFETSPFIKTYVNHAYPFGIIEANFGEDVLSRLLCDKYVNCIYVRNDRNKFYITESDNWFEQNGVMTHKAYMCIEKSMSCVEESIAETKRRLSVGEYVLARLNEGRLSAVNQGRTYDFDHECLIYGFDDEAKQYRTAGYIKRSGRGKQYVPYSITYEEYADALYNVECCVVELLFYKVNTDIVLPDADTAHVRLLLKQYVESDNPEYTNREDLRDLIAAGELKFGISAWDELATYIKSTESDSNIDMRYIRQYYEHKLLMKKRMQYLSEGVADLSVIKAASIVSEESQKVMALSLKYNMSRNVKLLDQISARIVSINEYEADYIRKVIDLLD